MRSVASKLDRESIFQDAGTVVLREGATFLVRTESATRRASRAASCLLEPEVDDHVLVASVGEECYVLAVLRRPTPGPACVALDGDLKLSLGGRLELAAAEGVRVTTPKDFTTASKGLGVVADSAAFTFSRLAVLGAALVGEIEQVKLVAGAVESVFERTVQRVKRSLRFVDGLDQVKAESIDYRAEKDMSLHAENALVTAKELVKVDGAQIHLG